MAIGIGFHHGQEFSLLSNLLAELMDVVNKRRAVDFYPLQEFS